MMMFTTEIPAVTSDGIVKYFEGVIIKAETFKQAEIKAKKMNENLIVTGEYISSAEHYDVLEF